MMPELLTETTRVPLCSFMSFRHEKPYSVLKSALKDAIGYGGFPARAKMLLREMISGKRRAIVTHCFGQFVTLQFLAARTSCSLLPETITLTTAQLIQVGAEYDPDGVYYIVSEVGGVMRDVCVCAGKGDDGRTYHRIAPAPRLHGEEPVVGIAAVKTITHGTEAYALFARPYMQAKERRARHALRTYPTPDDIGVIVQLNNRASLALKRSQER
mgnify:CR=1 FL=1